jgi:hypothetical protein
MSDDTVAIVVGTFPLWGFIVMVLWMTRRKR